MREANDTLDPKEVAAIVCSDIHLQHRPPIARSNEPDWYEAMARPLLEISTLCRIYSVPLIIAGDVCNRWDSPPELINFAIKMLPKEVYAVPGQHDLPNHRYDRIKKSAYWTLVEAGSITNLEEDKPYYIKERNIVLYGFPWNAVLKPRSNAARDGGTAIHIAVVHKYIWIKGHSFPGARREDRAKTIIGELDGYDAIVAGDNHSGFLIQ